MAIVMIAVNDDAGNFSGRCDAVQFEIGEDEWALEHGGPRGMTVKRVQWTEPKVAAATGDRLAGVMRFGGYLHIPYRSYATWVGNMCWDQFECSAPEAKRLLDFLRLRPEWTVTAESHAVLKRE